MEEDGRPGSWYIAAQQGQICWVVISLPSATTHGQKTCSGQCSAPARHSEDLYHRNIARHNFQRGCKTAAGSRSRRTHIATRSDSRLHSRATATHRGSPISRSRDARSPRPRTRAARAEFPALASPPRGPESRERSVGVTVTPCAVPVVCARGTVLRGWTARPLWSTAF